MPKRRSYGFILVISAIVVFFAAIAGIAVVASQSTDRTTVASYQFKQLPFENLQGLIADINLDRIKEFSTNIAVVRVPDTPQHTQVQNYIVGQFEDTRWSIVLDRFEDTTPLGKKTFTNIIASYNEDAENLLLIGAHYDSKYFRNFEFRAATDSAVPCAILIDLAQRLDPLLPKLRAGWGVVVTFFDGEEAFGEWTATDSLYGSRHLAAEWSRQEDGKASKLSRIHTFLLLDLIGASHPSFHNAYPDVQPAFESMLTSSKSMFSKGSRYGHISDDHEPFLERGVRCLHMIASPFPSVWHKATDTIENVDFNFTVDIARIVNVFVLELLQLNGKGADCTYCK